MPEGNSKFLTTLISEAKAGSPKSFGRLVALYTDTVYSLLFRLSMSTCFAAGQTKTVFEFVRRNIFQIRMNIPMADWLHGIVVHHFLTEYRSHQNDSAFVDFKEPLHDIQGTLPNLHHIDLALYHISLLNRILLVLSDFKHYKVSEIHDLLPEISETEIRERLRKTRRSIMAALKK